MYTTTPLNWIGQGDPQRLEAAAVAANRLPLWVPGLLAGAFTAADDKAGAPKAVLLSYRLWKARFGGDAAVLGRKMILDGAPNTIIGVMPPDFRFPSNEADIWQPMGFPEEMYQDRANNFVTGIARLKPGVSLERAREELNSIAAQRSAGVPTGE